MHVQPAFGNRPVSSITTAEVSEWAGKLVTSGRSPATAKRALATLRSILGHAMADERLLRNVALTATAPTGRERREGQALTWPELEALVAACREPDSELVAATIAKARADGRGPHEWLFRTLGGSALREGNWKRSVGWSAGKRSIGRPTLRVHDLRHTAASLWIAAGADPKVLQRILGHASATMTMDLTGYLMDANLWEAARRVGDWTGTVNTAEIGENGA